MAGQRSYYSNVLTTTRGQVEVKAKFTIVTGGSPSATLVSGRGIDATKITFTNVASGTNNGFTITFPEKYGNCVNIGCSVVGTSGVVAPTTSDYSATTGKATFALCTYNGLNNVHAGVGSGTFTVYLDSEFELGS